MKYRLPLHLWTAALRALLLAMSCTALGSGGRGIAHAQTDVPHSPVGAASALPPDPTVSPLLNSGEILLWGYLDSMEDGGRAVTVQVTGFSLPNGRSQTLAEPKLKTVQLPPGSACLTRDGDTAYAGAINIGTPLRVIGTDSGFGNPLAARELRCVTDDMMPQQATPEIIASPILGAGAAYPGSASAGYSPAAPAWGRPGSCLVRRFSLHDYSLQISYVPGGHNASQAVARTQGAVFAFGGGYFEPRSKRTIDYVLVNGRQRDDYRFDWQRPIIAVAGGAVRILRPSNPNHATTQKMRFDYALATDDKSTRPAAYAGRQIFGIQGDEMVFVRCYSSEAAARRLMADLGVTDYVWLDGGSPTPPWARIPTRLVVVPRPAAPAPPIILANAQPTK